MRRPLLAISLCLLSQAATAQDSLPASAPASMPASTPAESQPATGAVPPPEITKEPAPLVFRKEIRNTSGFSVNLIGLQNSIDYNWSKPLFQTDNVLLSGAHIAFGLNNSTSPAYTRVTAWVEFSPLSILDFRVGVTPSFYFGTFSTIINFADYNADYSEAAILAIDDQHQPGFTGMAYFEPTFKIKFKNVILASYADFELWKLFTTEVAPDFFYESQRDTLVDSSGDLVVQGANVLLYDYNINEAAGRKLIAGISHDWLTVPGGDNDNTRQTIGLLTVTNLSKRMGSLYKPTLIAKAFFYAQDRADLLKAGEFGAQFAFRFYIGAPRP